MDNIENRLVSIIMPAHNAARFIGEAIDSVLAQTYTHWELLVIDDASTDNTPEIIKAYSDPRIQYHRVPRIGSPSGVRNAGLHKAQGEFIAFLDADDCYYPHALDRLMSELLANPELTAVYGFANNMDENGEPLAQLDLLVTLDSGEKRLPTTYIHNWEKIITGNISCLLAGLMIHRGTFESVGFFNESLCGPEDYEFYIRLFLDRFHGVHCFPEYIYRYRIYAASLTKTPEHYERILGSTQKIMYWFFNEAAVAAEVSHLKSKAYTSCYRYQARERLIHHQPHLTRTIAISAFRNPNVQFRDWMIHCLPLLLRSLLPSVVDSSLVSLRSHLRQRYQFLKAQVQACCL